MFEKNNSYERYIREEFSMEEKIYKNYINMREIIGGVENMKYSKEDKYLTSEEFKQGFIAGVKVISSLLLDL